jgi:CRP-like cAMP-binding protein
LEAGERVLTAGASGDEAYLVIEGEAVVKLDSGVRTLTAGDLFGELALMTDSPRRVDVDAVTDLELMALSRTQFEQQLVSHPEQALELLRSLLTRYTESLNTGYVG